MHVYDYSAFQVFYIFTWHAYAPKLSFYVSIEVSCETHFPDTPLKTPQLLIKVFGKGETLSAS